ncbi:MAG: cyclin-dependent kinase inhibitor 3 family protein, partial [Candidatus Thiodiazotropha sp.]
HPLQIAEVQASSEHGRIGITFCPGKHDLYAHTGAWKRDLETDLDVIAAWGAKRVITLVEQQELRELKVLSLGDAIQGRGIQWRHLPIADFSVPDEDFEQRWITQGREIRQMLLQGQDVLVHCKGGLGRAGMIAARLLVELGMQPEVAIRRVRRARKGAIETSSQLALVRRTPSLMEQDAMFTDPLVIDTTEMQRVSGQLGSNPAGLYEDQEGQRYYVKTLESVAHARNEFIAAMLYRLAGAPTLSYVRTRAEDQIATRWLELEKSCVARLSESERAQAQRWFGVHAWTANWDAAGYHGDNQGVLNGRVLTLDVGGALEFRAQGDPKGSAFDTRVNELEMLRSDEGNPHAVRLFSDMRTADIRRSLEVVIQLEDLHIRGVILAHGGSEKLAEKMLARKAALSHYLESLGHA